MNCPSRTDEPLEHDGLNQNPSALSADLTKREDLNGKVNRRTNQDSSIEAEDDRIEPPPNSSPESSTKSEPHTGQPLGDSNGNTSNQNENPQASGSNNWPDVEQSRRRLTNQTSYESFPELDQPNTHSSKSNEHHMADNSPNDHAVDNSGNNSSDGSSPNGHWRRISELFRTAVAIVTKFLGFVGPGFMVAVAYIDPGNYSTDVAAGVATKFKLLFIVLMSNIFAIVLQSLTIRLGTVTGLNLAENCRAHLPRWLNYALYILGEGAIISTDIAEVSVRTYFQFLSEIDPGIGHRLRYSSQLVDQGTSGMGLSDHCGRRSHHPLILQPQKRLNEAFEILRVFRRCSGAGRSDLLLHRTFFHSSSLEHLRG